LKFERNFQKLGSLKIWSSECEFFFIFFNPNINNALIFNSDESTKTISRQVPDSITSWVITGFSVCPDTGLALTKKPSKFSVFQPFFVSTNLPYSIKRGEIVSIPILLFNYMDKDQTADVTFFNDENEFEFVDLDSDKIIRDKKRSKTTYIKANDGATILFAIRPLKVGNITIKVIAETLLAGDGIEKQLRVEPEGVTHFVNDALLVDLRNISEIKKNFELSVPDNTVPDSIFIEVSAIGDILGPTIDNLDQLM
jgi:CD109 antigen